MPKIRVDAEPINVSIFDQVWQNGGWYITNAEFKMPKLGQNGEIDQTETVTGQLTRPVKIRSNREDQHGSRNHLRLTRFNDYRIIVPVILNFAPTETDEPTGDGVTSVIGCI